jgi:hypothetical protein
VILTLWKRLQCYMNYVAMWFNIFYFNISTSSLLLTKTRIIKIAFSSQNFIKKDFGLPLRLDTQSLLFLSKLLCPLEIFFWKARLSPLQFFFLPHREHSDFDFIEKFKLLYELCCYVVQFFLF